ncbi:MAG: hypothetical protein AVDCRST_MAG02-1364, partial [uncultured Rubrobacteraceae bacterium]
CSRTSPVSGTSLSLLAGSWKGCGRPAPCGGRGPPSRRASASPRPARKTRRPPISCARLTPRCTAPSAPARPGTRCSTRTCTRSP